MQVLFEIFSFFQVWVLDQTRATDEVVSMNVLENEVGWSSIAQTCGHKASQHVLSKYCPSQVHPKAPSKLITQLWAACTCWYWDHELHF